MIFTEKPKLRKGVGMMIINKSNQIFIGQRNGFNQGWQMPQGGIDKKENAKEAIFREMEEEIGCNKGLIIAEIKNWLKYTVPKEFRPKIWNNEYYGQKQKWFLIKFTGEDKDINIKTEKPEFVNWKWIHNKELLNYTIYFKLNLYKQILSKFIKYII